MRILDPFGAGSDLLPPGAGSWVDDLSRYVARKMAFGDAVLAREADRYGAEALVTRNVKDFQGRTAGPVIRPDRFRRSS